LAGARGAVLAVRRVDGLVWPVRPAAGTTPESADTSSRAFAASLAVGRTTGLLGLPAPPVSRRGPPRSRHV